MELIELVSPHVAMPVIGVVVCAIMVFAFGFRSPVQPPSFNFEDDKRNKRKSKSAKVKTPTNGHVVISETPADNSKTAPKPVKETKAAASPKAKSVEGKTNKKDKVEPKQEKKEKVKKPAIKEEALVFKEKVAANKKEIEDDGEWTTIQMTKKGKKQQKPSKKDGGHADSAVESEMEVETTPLLEAAAASPAEVPEVDGANSPQASKKDKKKKKDKVAAKGKDSDKEIEMEIPVVAEAPIEDKKKKNKKEKKNADAGAAAAAAPSEKPPQDAAPASAKAVKKETPQPIASPAPANEAKSTPKKKKNKVKEDIQEEKPAIVETKPEPKSTPKKKESKIEKSAEPKATKTAEVKTVETKAAAPKQQLTPKKSEKKKQEPSVPVPKAGTAAPEPAVPTEPKKAADSSAPGAASVTFDEIGDAWQEAAPKSKKKKPRRDN